MSTEYVKNKNKNKNSNAGKFRVIAKVLMTQLSVQGNTRGARCLTAFGQYRGAWHKTTEIFIYLFIYKFITEELT